MPVELIFRCEICGRTPSRETRESLEHELLDPRFGEYVDAEPEQQPGRREIDFERARRFHRAAGPRF